MYTDLFKMPGESATLFKLLCIFSRCLIAERKAKKDKAPMTDRLMAKALALQDD